MFYQRARSLQPCASVANSKPDHNRPLTVKSRTLKHTHKAEWASGSPQILGVQHLKSWAQVSQHKGRLPSHVCGEKGMRHATTSLWCWMLTDSWPAAIEGVLTRGMRSKVHRSDAYRCYQWPNLVPLFFSCHLLVYLADDYSRRRASGYSGSPHTRARYLQLHFGEKKPLTTSIRQLDLD